MVCVDVCVHVSVCMCVRVCVCLCMCVCVQKVPKGVLCFFPSYKALEKLTGRWKVCPSIHVSPKVPDTCEKTLVDTKYILQECS